jgi:hypothetical protein
MKRAVKRLTRAELLANFPIDNLVDGWFFRLRETSPLAWQADGSDEWGRRVSCQGGDDQSVLDECAQMARAINAQLRQSELSN